MTMKAHQGQAERLTGGAVSRRVLLWGAASALGLAVNGKAAHDAAAQEKVSKAEARYQPQPKGQQRCEICLNFQPPNQCTFVAGQISPKGWCQFFAAKENAQ
jgi:hypothetical protein